MGANYTEKRIGFRNGFNTPLRPQPPREPLLQDWLGHP